MQDFVGIPSEILCQMYCRKFVGTFLWNGLLEIRLKFRRKFVRIFFPMALFQTNLFCRKPCFPTKYWRNTNVFFSHFSSSEGIRNFTEKIQFLKEECIEKFVLAQNPSRFAFNLQSYLASTRLEACKLTTPKPPSFLGFKTFSMQSNKFCYSNDSRTKEICV